MRLGAIFILLLAVIPASAKVLDDTTKGNPQACPLLIEDYGYNPTEQNLGNFYLRYRNQSDKTVIGVTFGVDIMNAVGDFNPSIESGLAFAGKTKPGKEVEFAGEFLEYDNYGRNVAGARAYIFKVAFSDGTTWEDKGTKACRLTYDMRKGIK